MAGFELGLYSFVELMADPLTGVTLSPRERFANWLEEVELADQVGLDVVGLGEHHRPDFLASAPAVALAAAAVKTRNVRLTSAVTVLSSDDPVRVLEQFYTLDLLSGGRAEVLAGRGSFIESFPLFGYDLDDYDALFDEKLNLLLRLRDADGPVTWQGRLRPPLTNVTLYPRPAQPKLPLWVAIGGTPASAARAGRLGLGLAIAIIGGQPARFAPLAGIYRAAGAAAGHAPHDLPLSLNLHGFIAESSRAAADLAFPSHKSMMDRLGRERGWGPLTRPAFEALRGPGGALMIGDPGEVAEKIVAQFDVFHHQRTLIQFSVGAVPHREMLRSIELYGTQVAPLVRQEIGLRQPSATT